MVAPFRRLFLPVIANHARFLAMVPDARFWNAPLRVRALIAPLRRRRTVTPIPPVIARRPVIRVIVEIVISQARPDIPRAGFIPDIIRPAAGTHDIQVTRKRAFRLDRLRLDITGGKAKRKTKGKDSVHLKPPFCMIAKENRFRRSPLLETPLREE